MKKNINKLILSTLVVFLSGCGGEETEIKLPEPVISQQPTVLTQTKPKLDVSEEEDLEEEVEKEPDTTTPKTTTPVKTDPKKDVSLKAKLEEVFLTSEIKNKLELYVKDDIKRTSDSTGYVINYKNKSENGMMIYKTNNSSAYWVHADIYKSFVQTGGLNMLGYPTSEQEFIQQDKLGDTVAKQTFEKGVIYYFNDPNLESFYENTLVKLYDDLKSEPFKLTYKEADLPPYSEKIAGKQGDPLNIIFIAKNQAQIEKAFEDSKWVQPKIGFKNLPFSALQMYGRVQDFGYARETSSVLTLYKRRHHIRFWKSDMKDNSNEVWVAAATEDVEVKLKSKELRQEEKENKLKDANNILTHKIDPNTDLEREYVRKTLLEKNDKIKTFFVKHPKIKENFVDTTNGSNDLVLWDGRILVVDLSNI